MNYLQDARKLQKEGKLTEAIALYRKGIAFNPTFSWYYHHLGECLAEMGNLDEAIASYRQAIELDPNSATFYHKLGSTLATNRDFEAARIALISALKFNKNLDTVHYELGTIFTKQGLLNEAIASYENAIKINPNYREFYSRLGAVLSKQKKWGKAVAAYRRAIEINPSSFEDIYSLGKTLEKQEKFKQAIASYRQAIKLNPNIAALHQRLGNSLKKLRRPQGAIASYKRAIELDPKRVAVRRQLARTFQELGRLGPAIKAYRHLVEMDGNNPDNYYNLGLLLAKQNKISEAISCYLECIKIDANYKQFYQSLGDILKELGNLEAAEACYQEKLSEDLWEKLNLWAEKKDWEITSISDPNNNFTQIKIHPATEISFSPPKTLEAKIHHHLSDEKLISPETFVAVIPDGRVWEYKINFAVITSENKLLEEATRRKKYSEDLIMSSPKMPPVFKIDGTVAAILGPNNYFTWICQVIPQIELLRRSGIEMETIDKFAIHFSNKSFEKQTLNLVGIPQEKIVSLADNHHIQASKLIVPSPLVTQEPIHVRIPEWSYEFLKREFLAGKDLENIPKKRRIYISRAKAKIRQVANEKEVMEFLSQYGFESVVLESLPVVEQASLMAEAEAVISPHGAGLTNAIFCSPGTKLIEIFSPIYVVKTYWIISDRCQLDYYYMMGEKSFDDPQAKRLAKLPLDQRCRFKNIFVSIDSLKKTMEFAGLI
ncbi:MAG: tetratricopeptide repeat protein [Cyanobacteriota bacterium]|nr:tetratricopeptide repeat protein [Cyanobacteriota bacterium]